ncbi:MAG: S41 family peptidase [Saprospiraceae bacterium]|nr:S41 family peptidase [Saprospiraceae bacterium]
MTEPQTPLSKFQTRLPLILALTLAVGMFIGQQLPRYGTNIRYVPSGQTGPVAGTLDEILRYIEARYVDTVGADELKVGAIEHLLEQLDPHSVYITPDELSAVEDDMSGGFEGVGIEFLMVDDTIQVVTPLSGGPSETAGILPGDKIVTINDTVVAGVKIDNGKIYKKLRGPKGSTVRLGILRGREQSLRAFTIVRDVIPVKSVDIAYMLDDKTGYVKINRFSARTNQEFTEALMPLSEKGMQNLVLDLRGNPGGYLEEATDLLSQFFPDGRLLVYTEGRAEKRREYKSKGRTKFNIVHIAVLIDEGSASASEIVAGAVQDWDRGWVVGRRSFGKGLVQEQYSLGDGGALRLTVARYFTPSGRCIQRDYKHTLDYDFETERRYENGELADSSKIRFADSTKYYTGMGRVVYGGGGITPDIFIPIDTSFSNDYFYEVRQHVPQFASRWMEGRPRGTLPSSLSAFVRSFVVSDDMLSELVDYAEKQGIARNEAALKMCRAELQLQLKARIAKILFHEEGLYSVLNDDDPAVEKALQVLRSGEPVAKK